jgi:hypothetical protein
MTRVGTTQAHRNLLKTLQVGLKSTAARVRLFEAIAARRSEWERLRAMRPKAEDIAARRSEWERLRASRPKAENIALRPVPPIIQWLAEGTRDEKKLEEWRGEKDFPVGVSPDAACAAKETQN